MATGLARRLLLLPATVLLSSALTFALATSAGSPAEGRGFEHLPRFLNLAPADAHIRARQALSRLTEGESAEGQAGLAALGGVALDQIVPTLDALSPGPRERVVRALAPVARRMLPVDAGPPPDPEAAALWWSRFWEEQALDFQPATVRRTVRRYLAHPSLSRAREVQKLDTAALDELFAVLGSDGPFPPEEVMRAVLPPIRHALGWPPSSPEGPRLREEALALRAQWFARRLDHTTLDGAGRVAAALLETQYGKWLRLAALDRVGGQHNGRSVLKQLRRQGPATLRMVGAGSLGGLVLGALLGAAAIGPRQRRWRLTFGALIVGLGCLVPALIALLRGSSVGLVAVAAATAPVVMGTIRAQARDELAQPHQLTAAAFGASRARAVRRAVWRALGGSGVGLLVAELPLALTAATLIERLSGQPGLGALFVSALIERDLAALMTIAALTTALLQIGLGAGESIVALFAPRRADP
jgi:ABC-type dipeptide/oligopeptide/nickel transport system permease component